MTTIIVRLILSIVVILVTMVGAVIHWFNGDSGGGSMVVVVGFTVAVFVAPMAEDVGALLQWMRDRPS
jgi:hypothetical protein